MIIGQTYTIIALLRQKSLTLRWHSAYLFENLVSIYSLPITRNQNITTTNLQVANVIQQTKTNCLLITTLRIFPALQLFYLFIIINFYKVQFF